MEMGSHGENNQKKCEKINDSNKGTSKSKRQMKTPFQREMLEKAYAMERYPTDFTRMELSDILGLSDKQLQMWFCRRRSMDRHNAVAKRASNSVVGVTPPLLLESATDELRLGGEPGSGNQFGSGSGSGSLSYRESGNAVMQGVMVDVPIESGYDESSPEVQRAILRVQTQVEGPFRDDGPILGIEFDSVPPDAFEEPKGCSKLSP